MCLVMALPRHGSLGVMVAPWRRPKGLCREAEMWSQDVPRVEWYSLVQFVFEKVDLIFCAWTTIAAIACSEHSPHQAPQARGQRYTETG